MSTQNKNQKELTEKLRAAANSYYRTGASTMTDHEYDRQLEELQEMEESSGIIYAGSPTITVGAAAVESLQKKQHEQPALSLDKFKYEDREKIISFLGGRDSFIGWKMDGLTVVLTYDNGKLTSAVTRGNGIEGSDITHNARYFRGIPSVIPFVGHVIVRGEAVMSYQEFERINAVTDGSYENPRNLAAATVQMLDSKESRRREICFKAFELVYPDTETELPFQDSDFIDFRSMHCRMNWLLSQGLDTIDFVFQHEGEFYERDGRTIGDKDILTQIEKWKDRVKDLPYPTDGLVITYDDQGYARSLGNTGHHSRGSIALKWTDETETTTLRGIEWSVGKTGVITPVAIFDPIRLGAGSTVTRASLHNVSVMRNVPETDGGPGKMMIGSKIEVGLANMIIPQVFSFHAGEKETKEIAIPGICPVCGQPTVLRDNEGVQTLHCVNEGCPARQLGRLMNTFGRDALYVKGLGESQIIDLMETGLVDSTPASFFKLKSKEDAEVAEDYDELLSMYGLLHTDGWGLKKWKNLIAAIDKARDTTLQRFLYSLNVTYLGNDLSKKLSAYWKGSVEAFMKFVDFAAVNPDAALEELTALDGVGEGKAMPLVEWAAEVARGTKAREDLDALIGCLHFDTSLYEEKAGEGKGASLEGLTFVITGAVHQYRNRDEFKASVEARGGKIAGSVSKKTDCLVNNDVTSTSGKNKKAKELGIPIISEDEFIEKYGK